MTLEEYFNKYHSSSEDEIQKRVAEIGHEIDTNPDANIDELNTELQALKNVLSNKEERGAKFTGQKFNPVTGNTDKPTKKEFRDDDVINTPEYRSAFLKCLLGHKLKENGDCKIHDRSRGSLSSANGQDSFCNMQIHCK